MLLKSGGIERDRVYWKQYCKRYDRGTRDSSQNKGKDWYKIWIDFYDQGRINL